jgi:hypothetical protein
MQKPKTLPITAPAMVPALELSFFLEDEDDATGCFVGDAVGAAMTDTDTDEVPIPLTPVVAARVEMKADD